MKLLPILLILCIIASPVVYNVLVTSYYPFQLMRDYKREKIPKAMVQYILDKYGDAKVSELRNIKVIENKETGCKHYFIEVFILDTSTHTKWNNPEKIYLFTFKLNSDGSVKYISHKERNVWDIGKLIPEDTDALLELNPALLGATREDIGIKRFNTCEENYCDKRECQTTASSVMCKSDTIVKTKNVLPPIFQVQSNNDHVSNEWQSRVRENKSKYNCEFILPEYSDMRHPYETSPFSCKQRYDLDHNPNRAPYVAGIQNEVKGPLKAGNYIKYVGDK